jgi:hypothetical protein
MNALMANKQIICILGMHRSGTSLITRLVNLLGVSLGPDEHLMKPLPDNPKGFWENRPLTLLNEEILSRLGGVWYQPPEFYSGWEKGAIFADLRPRALTLVNENFGAAKLWGWKDPRNCLTLPFWRSLLPNLRCLICIRNPVDVVHSLECRDKFSFDKGANLWFTYMRSALANSVGQPRLFVSYEEIMSDWQGALPRIAGFIGMPDAVDQPELEKNVKELIDAELQHHRTSTVDALAEQRLPFAAKSLYFVLKQFTSLDRSRRRCPDHRQNLELDLFSNCAAEAQAETDSLRTTLEGVRTTLERLRTTIDGQKNRLAAKEQLVARLQNELKVNKSNQKLLESALERERQARELLEASVAANYADSLPQIREVVRSFIPAEATVLVVSKGDNELLKLEGRQTWHFPRGERGEYAGYYPADSANAIAHLESLIVQGGEFLLFPDAAFWWLEHYRDFQEYLDQHHDRIATDARCIIFKLAGQTINTANRRYGHEYSH